MENIENQNQTRLRLTLAYDGTDYFGWQKQPQAHQPSVQATLEKCLSQIYQVPIKTIGSGRTDRGVHARGQVAHFDVPGEPSDMELKHKLQQMTPPSISILNLQKAPARFHAQLWVRSKSYEYVILNRPDPDPFLARYSLHRPWKMDVGFLNEASHKLLGTHDFKSFQSAGTPVPDTERTITKAQWEFDEETSLLKLKICGNGFLKQMVRNIVGLLLDLERTGKPSKTLLEVLEAKDRQKAGSTAPPHGLFLDRVEYGEEQEGLFQDLPSRFRGSGRGQEET